MTNILSGEALQKWAIENITPYSSDRVNNSSINLGLGPLLLYPRWYWKVPGLNSLLGRVMTDSKYYWKEHNLMKSAYYLPPKGYCLACTIEETNLYGYSALLLLRSSTARGILEIAKATHPQDRGISHLKAGWGDKGFQAVWTLEFVNHAFWPQYLSFNSQLVQLVLYPVSEDTADYDGRYQGDKTVSPKKA